MRSPRVQVSINQAFYEALVAFAEEHEVSPASVLIRGAKSILSKSHRWRSGTRGRPLARTRIGIKPGVCDDDER